MNAEQFHNAVLLIAVVFCVLMALAIVGDMLRSWLERRKQ